MRFLWQEKSVKLLVILLMDPRMFAIVFHINQILPITENNLQIICSILINTIIKRNIFLVPDIKM